jgi:hypothetical protein
VKVKGDKADPRDRAGKESKLCEFLKESSLSSLSASFSRMTHTGADCLTGQRHGWTDHPHAFVRAGLAEGHCSNKGSGNLTPLSGSDWTIGPTDEL